MGFFSKLFGGGSSGRGQAQRALAKQKDYYTDAMSRMSTHYQGQLAQMQSNMASLQASATQQAEEMQAEANAALARQRAQYQAEARRVAKARKTAAFAMKNRQEKMAKQVRAKTAMESIKDTGERLGGGAGSRIARRPKPKRRVASGRGRGRGRGGSRPA